MCIRSSYTYINTVVFLMIVIVQNMLKWIEIYLLYIEKISIHLVVTQCSPTSSYRLTIRFLIFFFLLSRL